MSHEVESMAYRHEVPWHGLGVKVNKDMTPEEMCIVAGCNWEVEKRPVGFKNKDNTITKIAGKNALVRATDEQFYSIVGDNWKEVQNAQLVSVFNKFCVEGGATMETLGALQKGKIIWALANLNSGFVAKNGEAIKSYVLLALKHEFGFASIGRFTSVCVVCANTFAQSGGFKGATAFRVPHTIEFDPDWAANQFEIMRLGSTEFEKNVNLLSSINIDRQTAIKILTEVFEPDVFNDEKLLKKAIDDPFNNTNRTVQGIMQAALQGAGADVRGNTAWGLFNGVTYYNNHIARGTKDSRLASTFVGTNNKNMNTVFQKLLELQ